VTAVPGTVHIVLDGLRNVLAPLSNRLTVAEAPMFFARLGVPMTAAQATSLAGTLAPVATGVTNFVRSVDELDGVLSSGELGRLIASQAGAIVSLSTVFAGLPALGTAVGALPGAPPNFAATFPQRLFDHLLTSFLAQNVGLNEILEFTGILDRVDVEPTDPAQDPFTIDTLHIGRIGDWLADPGAQLATRFGWNAPGFTGVELFTALDRFFAMLGLPVLLDLSGPTPVLDLVYSTIRPRLDLDPPGIAITLDADTQPLNAEFTGPDWKFTVSVEFALPHGAEILLQPGGAVTVNLPEATTAAGRVRIGFTKLGQDGNPLLLFGIPGASRLEAGSVGAELEIGLRWEGAEAHGDIGVRGTIEAGKLVIDLGEGDGFLSTIIPGRLENDFSVGIGYSSEDGLHFEGSGVLRIQLPAHLELGPVELTGMGLSFGIEGDKLPVGLTADVTATLGPLTAVVAGVGLGAELRLVDGQQGNLGPLDLSLVFKPPTGVGLAVDVAIVTGGGFLYFDPDNGEYAGVLELEFAGFVAVKAIGLITTRMPDGSKGFSLLIVLTAEFGGGGIQLGFGFTLLGVGGILGLNRRMDLDALVEGVVTGSIQSVMFPKDVVANAPRIISDLRRFFPPEDGTFLVGPMAKIGWGTPTLVSVSLGLIVEVPPGNIAILGVLECVLPSEDIALLALRVSFVGALEVDKSRLWFFAKLFDSRILTMTIDGGMGLLVVWGDNPDFVLSVGGFHPAFTPPPLPFPAPPRLSVDILNSPGQLIRVSGYFAVTSNTVQFGAKAELRLGISDFGIEGHLSFDALFRFSPFSFIVQISAGVSLKAFGVGVFSIDLNFTLEGPAPWRAHGRGSITLLFFEISADFDITWGEERTTTLPPVAVLALLAAEVDKTEGWQTRLPAGGANPLVTLRPLTPDDDLVLHPLGSLFIQQRAIPLGVRIDRVGAQRPSDGRRFTVEPAQGGGLVRRSVTGDRFAMAQFQDMDDAAKLSRPAYEIQDAGLELVAEGGAIASPRVVRRSARYEMSVVDTEAPGMVASVAAVRVAATRTSVRGRLYTPPPTVFNQLLAGSSTARSPLSRQEAKRRQPFAAEDTVRVPGSRWVVAYLRNNRQAFPPATASATTSSFRSAATAEDAVADWIHADPSLAGQLHVLRQAEVAGGTLAEPGVWSAAGAPPAAVAGADAVRLSGGQALVAGGADAGGTAVATTALFDPVAGAWATGIGSLAAARRRHTVTRLGDGRVVAAGGLGTDGTPLSTVEVFDPVARTWSGLDAAMATARSGHSAVIADRKLLVAGGTSARGAALASAESLDPATWTWTAVGPMTEARTGHVAVVLGTGAVLVAGGAVPTGDGERALASCELYDPGTKTWTMTGSLHTPRKGHQATLLPGGKVLVTGGDAVPAIPYRVDSLASAEVYDPATGEWTPVADMPGGGRRGHRCVRTPRGAVVIGGVGRPHATAGYRDVVAFSPATGSWTATGAMATGRWDFAAVDLADGRVLAVGGHALAGPAAPGDAELATTAETYLP
jgi:hypothetical protein